MGKLNGLFALETASQVANKLLVHQRVDVLAEQKKDKPISNLTLACHLFDFVTRSEPCRCSQEVHACLGSENDSKTVEQGDAADDSKQNEPEPKENVDLFVDDVER